MLSITENGTISGRLLTLIDHFSKGNKASFGRLADIQSGVLAGIVGGRGTKPGFELLQKLLTAYPTISPDWLLFGSGGMLRGQSGLLPPVMPPVAQPGNGIRTRLIYSCELPEKGARQKDSFSVETIRYLPYRIKKKHRVLEEAEGDLIEVTDIILDTERGEHRVYFTTHQVDNETHFNELRETLFGKGWVDEGFIDTPEQFKLRSNGQPNPLYDPRFDGIFSDNQTSL